ncbi:hypothetical protein MKW92_012423, partial [Papaver armeniacum]
VMGFYDFTPCLKTTINTMSGERTIDSSRGNTTAYFKNIVLTKIYEMEDEEESINVTG